MRRWPPTSARLRRVPRQSRTRTRSSTSPSRATRRRPPTRTRRSTSSERLGGRAGAEAPPRPLRHEPMTIVADVPARPDGLELIGEMVGSGYRTPPSLVRRQDGQTLQVTPLLYGVLEAVDGRRTYAEIAQLVSERSGRSVAASDVEALVERQLRPLGLLLQADGTPPALERSNPL